MSGALRGSLRMAMLGAWGLELGTWSLQAPSLAMLTHRAALPRRGVCLQTNPRKLWQPIQGSSSVPALPAQRHARAAAAT